MDAERTRRAARADAKDGGLLRTAGGQSVARCDRAGGGGPGGVGGGIARGRIAEAARQTRAGLTA